MMVRIRKERNKEYLSNTPSTLKTLIHMIRKGKKKKKKKKEKEKRKNIYVRLQAQPLVGRVQAKTKLILPYGPTHASLI